MDDVRLIDANIVMSKLKAEVDNIPKRTNYPIGIADGISYAMATIDCAQTIDAQPVKRGHWKQSASGEMYCCYCQYVPQWEDDKFCANCGARMDGDSE